LRAAGEAAPTAADADPPSAAPIERRLWAPAALVKILNEPDRDAPVIGVLRNGQSVALRDEAPVKTRKLFRCEDAWYPVEPRGWVCVGGPGHGTLDGRDPAVRAAADALPAADQAYPFEFGVSVGAPRYRRIPTRAEQRQAEPDLEHYLASLPAADPAEGGAVDARPVGWGPSKALLRYFATVDPPLTVDVPAYPGMKLAWARQFDAQGRTWLLTPDLYLVPKDKVRQQPLPPSRGVDLRARPELALPLAFAWLGDVVKHEANAKGEIVATDETWPRDSFVPITGALAKGERGRWYYQMRDGGYAYYPEVTAIKPRQPPTGVGPDQKWVHIRVTWGWMVAYEGATPVYAAAVSPGIDGISPRAHATAKGRHFVRWKLLSGDMSGRDRGKDWFVDEVPWVQYYQDNFAIHGAWWHDEFGRPKSHGCINVAPADALWLFAWMDPAIPEGWYGVSPHWPIAQSTPLYIQY